MDAETIATTADAPAEIPPEYAIVEIMGHRKLAGRILEVERFGAKLLRIDIPTDADFFDFDQPHYHVDARFVTLPKRSLYVPHGMAKTAQVLVSAYPLASRGNDLTSWQPHPPVVWKRRVCLRNVEPYPFGREDRVAAMRDHYAGQLAPLVDGVRICPHRGAPLSSLPAVGNCITCPLHGLKFDATTWRAYGRSNNG